MHNTVQSQANSQSQPSHAAGINAADQMHMMSNQSGMNPQYTAQSSQEGRMQAMSGQMEYQSVVSNNPLNQLMQTMKNDGKDINSKVDDLMNS